MSSVRRVVTGVDVNDHSVVVSDGPAPNAHDFVHIPGMSTVLVWATLRDGARPEGEGDPDPTLNLDRDLPGVAETRFVVVRFPPDSVMQSADFDARAAGEEQRVVSPQLAARFAADEGGMHTTDTTDYAIVLDGRIHLELDQDVQVALDPGDTVVQNGTRHAWRNHGRDVATVAFINLGPLEPVQPGRD